MKRASSRITPLTDTLQGRTERMRNLLRSSRLIPAYGIHVFADLFTSGSAVSERL